MPRAHPARWPSLLAPSRRSRRGRLAFACPRPRSSRIETARGLVQSIVARDIRAYGVNTGVGALCDVIVTAVQAAPAVAQHRHEHTRLRCRAGARGARGSRGHRRPRSTTLRMDTPACGPRWSDACSRSWSRECIPEVPARRVGGIPGAHGAYRVGAARRGPRPDSRRALAAAAAALQAAGIAPLVLEAKEGLSLVNGTPCVTGLTALALDAQRAAAGLGGSDRRHELREFARPGVGVRARRLEAAALAGALRVGERLRPRWQGSAILAAERRAAYPGCLEPARDAAGARRGARAIRTCLRRRRMPSWPPSPTIPWCSAACEAPRALSEAHAVGAAIGLSADSLGIASRRTRRDVGTPHRSTGQPAGERIARHSWPPRAGSARDS